MASKIFRERITEDICKAKGGEWSPWLEDKCRNVAEVGAINTETGKVLHFEITSLNERENLRAAKRAIEKIKKQEPVFFTDLSLDTEFMAGSIRERIKRNLEKPFLRGVSEEITTENGVIEFWSDVID